MSHIETLKTWPEYFRAIRSREKTFELRLNDRDFKVGCVLLLKEFEPCRDCKSKGKIIQVRQLYTGMHSGVENCPSCHGTGGCYTGAEELRVVTYVLKHHEAIRTGYVILGLYEPGSD